MDLPDLTAIDLRHEPGSPVATVLFNRPDRLNALSRVLLREVVAVSDWLNHESLLRSRRLG